jgi:hypothetical protein
MSSALMLEANEGGSGESIIAYDSEFQFMPLSFGLDLEDQHMLIAAASGGTELVLK